MINFIFLNEMGVLYGILRRAKYDETISTLLAVLVQYFGFLGSYSVRKMTPIAA